MKNSRQFMAIAALSLRKRIRKSEDKKVKLSRCFC